MEITPEIQKLIDDAVAAAVEPLAANNKKLTGELKSARAKTRSEVDPEEHAALQSKLDEVTAQLEKATKTGEAELRKTAKALESEKAFTRKLLVDNGIVDAATKAGVKPEYMDAVKAMLASQVQVNEEGDTRAALVNGKPLAEHMQTWAQSDQGKHFVAAPANGGGGANGSNGNGGPAGNATNRSKMSYTEKASYIKEQGIDKYNALPL